MKSLRIVLGIVLLVSAALALAAGVRLIVAHRLPDGTLSLGFAVVLGTCGVVWLLIERRMAASRRTARAGSTR